MENYKEASRVGQEMILAYFKKRMKEKKITQQQLADILQIGRTTLIRYFKMKSPMPLSVYLEICGALQLRPYLIPAEDDKREMQRMFFN
tara:strand:+ start:34 stop:300 length:267 start_codon:yes stop_codon:yes gene_type:complete